MDNNFKKNLIRGATATSIGQISTLLIYFVTTVILARELETVIFGEFALILAIAGIMQLVSSIGLESTLVKFITDEKSDKNLIYLKFLLIRVVSLIFISILFFLISNSFVLFDPKINDFTFYIILIFLLSSLRDFFNSQLVGVKKFKAYAYVQVFTALLKLSIYIIGFFLHLLDLKFLITVEILVLLFSFILQQILSPVRYSYKITLTTKELKEIFNFSYPLYFNGVLHYANTSLNSFIITGYLGTVSLAQYSVADKIPSAILRLYTSFIIVFFPSISSLFNQNQNDDAKELINKTISALNVFIAPLILLAFMFKEQSVILLFSVKYLPSAFAFFLLVLVIYFRSISSISGYSIVAMGKPLHSFIINFVSTIIGLTLAIILTPAYGIVGAVYSILISNLISAVGGILILRGFSIDIKIIPIFYPLILSLIFILLYKLISVSNIVFSISWLLLFLGIQVLIFRDFRNSVKILFKIIAENFNKVILKRA